MRISCIHGYFKFWESKAGQISAFMSTYGFDLVAVDDYFTFDFMVGALNYSLQGGLYLGAPAIKTFEGEPGEVMRKNRLVYDFSKDEVVSIDSISNQINLTETNRYFLTTGMILPGSLTDEGERVTDYSAFYLFDSVKFKYSEVTFE